MGKVTSKIKQKIQDRAGKKVAKVKEKADQVKGSLDQVLEDNEGLKRAKARIAKKVNSMEKEKELAMNLALKVLDRASKIRKGLQRKKKKSSPEESES